jgi:hypothetical protein
VHANEFCRRETKVTNCGSSWLALVSRKRRHYVPHDFLKKDIKNKIVWKIPINLGSRSNRIFVDFPNGTQSLC